MIIILRVWIQLQLDDNWIVACVVDVDVRMSKNANESWKDPTNSQRMAH